MVDGPIKFHTKNVQAKLSGPIVSINVATVSLLFVWHHTYSFVDILCRGGPSV